MRRVHLSDVELNQVIVLRQAGSSWLKIEQQAGIPRRAAKRAYDDWVQRQEMEEYKKVRMDAVAEAFGEHVKDIIRLAEAIADRLPLFPLPTDIRRADEAIRQLLVTGLQDEYGTHDLSAPRGEREARRQLRYREALLDSLKQHTREKVRWQTFEEWQQVWDRTIDGLAEIRLEASSILGQMLDRDHELRDKIAAAGILERMAAVVVEAAYRGALEGILEIGDELVQLSELHAGRFEIAVGKEGSLTAFTLTDESLAEDVAKICKAAIRGLCRGEKQHFAVTLSGHISRVQAARNELEDMLNSPVLRPLILHTRCDLCPA